MRFIAIFLSLLMHAILALFIVLFGRVQLDHMASQPTTLTLYQAKVVGSSAVQEFPVLPSPVEGKRSRVRGARTKSSAFQSPSHAQDKKLLPSFSNSPSPLIPLPPKVFYKIIPAYPKLAREMGVSAMVKLLIKVGQSGEVIEARAQNDPGFGFASAALIAVRQFRYEPARDASGEAIEYEMTHEVVFEIGNDIR